MVKISFVTVSILCQEDNYQKIMNWEKLSSLHVLPEEVHCNKPDYFRRIYIIASELRVKEVHMPLLCDVIK